MPSKLPSNLLKIGHLTLIEPPKGHVLGFIKDQFQVCAWLNFFFIHPIVVAVKGSVLIGLVVG